MSEIDEIQKRVDKRRAVYLCEGDDGRNEIWSNEAEEDIRTLLAAITALEAERDEADQRYVEQLERADAAVGDRDHELAALEAQARELREVYEATLAYRRRERQADYSTRQREHMGPPSGSISEAREALDAAITKYQALAQTPAGEDRPECNRADFCKTLDKVYECIGPDPRLSSCPVVPECRDQCGECPHEPNTHECVVYCIAHAPAGGGAEARTCFNCLHRSVRLGGAPCGICQCHSQWTAPPVGGSAMGAGRPTATTANGTKAATDPRGR